MGGHAISAISTCHVWGGTLFLGSKSGSLGVPGGVAVHPGWRRAALGVPIPVVPTQRVRQPGELWSRICKISTKNRLFFLSHREKSILNTVSMF